MPAKIKFTDEQVKDIVTRYQGGESVNHLTKIYNCSHFFINKFLKQAKIKVRHFLLEEKSFDIVKNYNNGAKVKDIAIKYNCSKDAVETILKKEKVVLRDFKFAKKYIVNENYFETIDTEDKAYWLGFILADGCIDSRDNSLIICLEETDKEHLAKFIKCINSTNPIIFNEKYTRKNHLLRRYARISIINKKLCSDLSKYGVVSRKSGKCYKSELIPRHLEKHFWRGCIDGDGSIYQPTNSKCSYLNLVADEKLAFSFTDFCKENNILYSIQKEKRVKTDFYSVKISAKDSFKNITNLLYEDAKTYLDRKFERYELFTGKLDWLL